MTNVELVILTLEGSEAGEILDKMRRWTEIMGDDVTNVSFAQVNESLFVSYEMRGEEDAASVTRGEEPHVPAA